MKQKKQPIFRKCSTVGALIKQLERLPKTACSLSRCARCFTTQARWRKKWD